MRNIFFPLRTRDIRYYVYTIIEQNDFVVQKGLDGVVGDFKSFIVCDETCLQYLPTLATS
jgi:hypothetical protein